MRRAYKYLVCDFETTVFEGQEETEVWASAVVEMKTEDVKIFHSIGETFDYFRSLNENLICYYHNLKFDGSFWLQYLLHREDYKQAIYATSEDPNSLHWIDDVEDMENNSYKYLISVIGLWYSITVKLDTGYVIEFRDSLKLLPFSVKKIGKDFETKHKKLEMEYEGFRYSGCEITDAEKEYIANDVLVVKEALEIMFKEGHKRLTIGSCCLNEFKKKYHKDVYKDIFPDLYSMKLNEDEWGSDNVGEYIRKSYKGGWCYLVKGKQNKKFHHGTTLDVNSLYPSMMHSMSGNIYPIGTPFFWQGNYIPDFLKNDINKYFFVRIKTRFYLREDYLPFIQIKNSYFYNSNEALETSDIYIEEEDRYVNTYIGRDGKLKDTIVELTLTQTDYYLFIEHYHLVDFQILDGIWFYTEVGIFDDYINKYKQIKQESKGAKRALAKLFLNNLYGKMATSPDSSFKIAYIKEDGALGFEQVKQAEKDAGYIAIGSAITSYARNFTIRAAQRNYYGKNRKGFIYADTDSIHCDLSPEEIMGVNIHDTEFCHWKCESEWDYGIFTRQKTYIEHIVIEDGEKVEPYYNVKCAGMPNHCKDLFVDSVVGYDIKENPKKYDEEELEFVSTPRTIEDFEIGLKIPGKLVARNIKGGILLTKTTYEMR